MQNEQQYECMKCENCQGPTQLPAGLCEECREKVWNAAPSLGWFVIPVLVLVWIGSIIYFATHYKLERREQQAAPATFPASRSARLTSTSLRITCSATASFTPNAGSRGCYPSTSRKTIRGHGRRGASMLLGAAMGLRLDQSALTKGGQT
jgi:hypothetical protein